MNLLKTENKAIKIPFMKFYNHILQQKTSAYSIKQKLTIRVDDKTLHFLLAMKFRYNDHYFEFHFYLKQDNSSLKNN